MKILQINSFFTVGGPPRIMNGIYDTLKENGFECKIAAAREKMYATSDSIKIGTDFSVKINALKARLFDTEGFNAIRATRKLIKEIEKYNPDVIHLHNIHGYCFNLEVLFEYLKKIDKPVIWTLHDCWSMTGHCAHFAFIGCEKWKTGCFSCQQSREYPSSFFADRADKNYILKKTAFSGIRNMTIVTPSKWLASFISNSILREYPVKVIHNGIDLKLFSYTGSDIKKKYRIENKKIVLGVAQNWAEKKGLEDFFELSKNLDDEYQIVLIGLTDKQKKNLPKKIIGLTRTQNVQELVEWYSVANIFVNFTYQDTFPTVNIEALGCGTPVLTYRTGGSPEAIDDSCGWIIEQGDIEEAVNVIHHIEDRITYSKACRERAKRFDRNDRYLEYIDLYREIVRG